MGQKATSVFGTFAPLLKFPSAAMMRLASERRRRLSSRAPLTPGVIGSLALLPLAMVQGAATRRRIPVLPPASAPNHGRVEGVPLRLLAIGESSVCGIGVSSSDETVAAVTARVLGRLTGRPVVWQALGLSGATVRDGIKQLIPDVVAEPVDLVVVAFGVNDTTSYRSPAAFADDLASLVTALRKRVGNAAVVIAGVAPINCFPALPWPLSTILGWRSKALQAAIDGLTQRLPRLVVERFSISFGPELFATDGFHPNASAYKLWGEEIAALALPLLECAPADSKASSEHDHTSPPSARSDSWDDSPAFGRSRQLQCRAQG